jgi:hypothetical protein
MTQKSYNSQSDFLFYGIFNFHNFNFRNFNKMAKYTG